MAVEILFLQRKDCNGQPDPQGHAKIKNRNEMLRFLVENTGFEPVTSCLPGKRSSQMS